MTDNNQSPHRIQLPGGDCLVPRPDFAGELRVNPRTLRRLNLPTTLIGGKAYVKRNASLKIIADGVTRANQPTPKSRSKRSARR
jgi:hypothetical protein